MQSKMQVRFGDPSQKIFSTSELGALGFETPIRLYEEPKLRISVTEGNSVYDAAIPGGLKVNR